MSTVPPALTQRFLEAVSLALEAHGDARRTGTEIPYLAHLLVVTGLVVEDGGDEDQAIAAMLHDAVEDGGGRPMLERIEAQFGPRVAAIVEGCSDTVDDEPDEPWLELKRRYLDPLQVVEDDAILRVSLADKVHNARSIVRDYRESGSALWERFTQKTARDQLWYYSGLLHFYSANRPGPLTEDLWRAVGELAWLVALEESAQAQELRLWLDPDLHARQAPQGWVQVRTPDEAIQILERRQAAALSLDDGDEALRVVDWLEHQEGQGERAPWPTELVLHGEPSAEQRERLRAALARRARGLSSSARDTSP